MFESLPGLESRSESPKLRERFAPRGLYMAREVVSDGILRVDVFWRSRLRRDGVLTYLIDPVGLESLVQPDALPPTWNLVGSLEVRDWSSLPVVHEPATHHLDWPLWLMFSRFVWEDVKSACEDRPGLKWLVPGTYEVIGPVGIFDGLVGMSAEVIGDSKGRAGTVRVGAVTVPAAQVARDCWEGLKLIEAS